jgi:hypothetical protein
MGVTLRGRKLSEAGRLFLGRWGSWLYAAFLAGLVLALYLPSLRFGLIWDDPRWYQQGAGQSFWQIVTSLPTYQFYRPLAILLNRQLVSANGVVHASLAHAIQIGAHLLATLLCIPVLAGLGLGRVHARLSALVFALHPFAYQAVAWQAPQQPLALLGVLLALLAAERFVRRRQVLFLVLSLLAYAAALLTQESALPLVFVFFWLALRRGEDAGDESRSPGMVEVPASSPLLVTRIGWPLLHLALGVVYVYIWLHVPRTSGVTGRNLNPYVLGYLLQGVIFPLARLVVEWPSTLSLGTLLAILSGGWLALGIGLWTQGKGRVALLSSAWIAASILPAWVGLTWDYVQVGSRILYPALPGIAALWGGWLAWVFTKEAHWLLRDLGRLSLVIVVGLSLQQWSQFQTLYQIGTRHLAETVSVLSIQPQARLLFVNFPDRLELRAQPYLLGYWGLTLAPVVQELSDYALAATGQSAQTACRASFTTGADARRDGPYRVDLRGENTNAEQFSQLAQQAQAIYLSDYRQNGSVRLREVGAVTQDDNAPRVATLGARLELVQSEVLYPQTPNQPLRALLVWRLVGQVQPGDTLFLHLLTPDGRLLRSQDGDALGGLLPLTAWQPGWLVHDQRDLSLVNLSPGDYALTVGLYNRDTDERYHAVRADGSSAYQGELQISTVRITGAP